MKVINWKTSKDFFLVMNFIRENEAEEVAVIIAKNTPFWWFHGEILKHLFLTKKFFFITRDPRIKKLLKSSWIKTYHSLREMQQIVPEWFQIIQENLSPLEYVRFHIMRFLSPIFSFWRKKIQFRKDIFVVHHSSWYALVLWIIVISLLIVWIISLTTPHAVLEITPQVNVQNAIRNVTFTIEDAMSESWQIPVRKDIFSFELSKTYNVNSYDPSSLERARGTIKVTNTGLKALKIKPHTRVSVETLVFRTEDWLDIPPARDSQPWEATVSVIADPVGTDGILIGKKGNIPENISLTFPWLSQEDHIPLSVISLTPFVGGGEAFKNLLTAEEYARIEKIFREELTQSAREQLLKKADMKSEFIPIPTTETVRTLDVTSSADQEIDAHTDRVTFSGKGNFVIYLYDVATLRKMLLESAQAHLLKNVESLVEISTNPPDIISVLSMTEDPWTLKATAQMPVQVLYDFSSSIGQKTLQNILSDLLWAEKDRAEKTLLNHPYIKMVDIRLTPFWTNRLPTTLDKIYIKTKDI